MTATNDLKASLIDAHRRIGELLATHDSAGLREKAIDRWTLLDVIGHVNAWGLEFMREARHLAEKPGQPFDYTISAANNYDDANEDFARPRYGWTAEQHAEENQRVMAEIEAFFDKHGDQWPSHPAVLPWGGEPTTVEGVLRIHLRHGIEHLEETEGALIP